MEDCGRKVILNNHIRAKKNFEQKYARNLVKWTGALKEKLGSNDPVVGVYLNIKMNPTDSNPDYFDVQLLLTRPVANKHHDLLNKLSQGDIIEFRAIMKVMGDEYHFNVMEALEIRDTGERIDLMKIPVLNYTGNAYLLRKAQQAQQPQLPAASLDIVIEPMKEKPKDPVIIIKKTEEPKDDTSNKPKENDQAAPVTDKKTQVNEQTNTGEDKSKEKVNDQAQPVKDEQAKEENKRQEQTTTEGSDQAAPVSDSDKVKEGTQQSEPVTEKKSDQAEPVSDTNQDGTTTKQEGTTPNKDEDGQASDAKDKEKVPDPIINKS